MNPTPLPGIHCREDGSVLFARGTKFTLWDLNADKATVEEYVSQTTPRLFVAGKRGDYYLFNVFPNETTIQKPSGALNMKNGNKLLCLHFSVFTEVERRRLDEFIINKVKKRLENG
jgi:hypothetical protein